MKEKTHEEESIFLFVRGKGQCDGDVRVSCGAAVDDSVASRRLETSREKNEFKNNREKKLKTHSHFIFTSQVALRFFCSIVIAF